MDETIDLTPEGYIQRRTGTFEVVVMKSANMKDSEPVVIQNTSSSDTRAFYRLQI